MKNRWTPVFLLLAVFIGGIALAFGFSLFIEWCFGPSQADHLVLNTTEYLDANYESLLGQLAHRIKVQPFNVIATLLFACAITHTLLANHIHRMAVRMDRRQKDRPNPGEEGYGDAHLKQKNWFAVEMTYFLGEVEVVFGLWVIPLFMMIACNYDMHTAVDYLNSRSYVEPLFVIVVMVLASTYPIVRFAEDCLSRVAQLGGGTPKAWWLTLLVLGPPLGSLITEPAAMTLTALLLGKHFFVYKPSSKFAFATVGLLFTNISVGGVLTHFAAPPAIMVAQKWGWTTPFMLGHFGVKAFIGIVLSVAFYYLLFRQEFAKLSPVRSQELVGAADRRLRGLEIPPWITVIHLLFLLWAVIHSHYPALFLSSFLLFLAFHQATVPFQSRLSLRSPLLVGFFLAGLIIHVSLQGWWIEPILPRLGEFSLMSITASLTAVTDNAALTALAALVSGFADPLKYAVVAGAVIGGGLTVIANAPNPAGQVLLQKYFEKGVTPVWLFCAALPPALIMLASFYLLRDVSFF